LLKIVHDGQHGIAWVTFAPFEENKVTWDNTYYLYASLTDPVEGTQITVNSSTAAQVRCEYTYTKDKSFSEGQHNSQLEDGQYEVSNQVPYDLYPWLTFGMAQTCTVNSIEKAIMPINAEVVLALQFAKFTTTETVRIFLASDIAEGTVHNNVKKSFQCNAVSMASEFSFTTANQTINVVYSASLGKFTQQ
jgi:hypothetical protein